EAGIRVFHVTGVQTCALPIWRLQRLGVARALLQDGFARLAEAGVRRCFLEVADDNRAAQALYAGFGFSIVGRRPGYYGQGEAARDALVLQAAITTPTV